LTVKPIDDLRILADTSGVLSELAPYVPALGDDGRVALQARTRDGASGVFLADAGGVTPLLLTPALRVVSHPARAPSGRVGVYARDADGTSHLVRVGVDQAYEVVPAPALGPAADIGPLGPTTNTRGDLAARAALSTGRAAIVLLAADAHAPVVVADTSSGFERFEGLPLVDDRGRVTFRADRADGAGIYRHEDGRLAPLVETGPGSGLAALGRFPCLDGPDAVVCVGEHLAGWSGIFRFAPGRAPEVLARAGAASSAFASIRGALASLERLVFYATPPGGALGVYRVARDAGASAPPTRLIGIGDALLGSTVVDLALNPVSIDARGAIAVRLALASGLELVATIR